MLGCAAIDMSDNSIELTGVAHCYVITIAKPCGALTEMISVPRVVGYMATVAASSAVFIIWMTCLELAGPYGHDAGIRSTIKGAYDVSPYFIFLIALQTLLPWILVTWIFSRLRWGGPVSFGISLAITVFLAFCTLAGVLPGRGIPTFVEKFELAA